MEAAESLGATRRQTLTKVQLPLARRTIGIGVNQTIMMALSMVVITALIGAPGLGADVLRALQQVNVGAAFQAGLAVVILAIVLDRLTDQAGAWMDPRSRPAEAAGGARRRYLIAGAIALGSIIVARLLADPSAFPDRHRDRPARPGQRHRRLDHLDVRDVHRGDQGRVHDLHPQPARGRS